MTIEITRPEVEALICQRLSSGRFADPQDMILDALRTSGEWEPNWWLPCKPHRPKGSTSNQRGGINSPSSTAAPPPKP